MNVDNIYGTLYSPQVFKFYRTFYSPHNKVINIYGTLYSPQVFEFYRTLYSPHKVIYIYGTL